MRRYLLLLLFILFPFQTVADITVIIKKFNELLRTQPDKLPRFNSSRSDCLFQYLTSFDSITAIAISFTEPQMQLEFLRQYAMTGKTLADTYAMASAKYRYYENESLLCSSANLHAHLLYLEILDAELQKRDPSARKMIFDNKTKLGTSKIVGRAYWGISLYLESGTYDDYVKSTTQIHLEQLKNRIEKLRLLDTKLVFDADRCWRN